MKVGDLVTHKDIVDIGPGLVVDIKKNSWEHRFGTDEVKVEEDVLVFWSDLKLGTTFQYADGLRLINESKE